MIKQFILVVIFSFLIFGCRDKTKGNHESAHMASKPIDDTLKVAGIDLKIYDYEGFKSYFEKKDGKVRVINFWATWCAPCIKELPYFEKLNKQYKNENVEVILVSLDFPHLYEKKLKPYIINNNLQSEVIALDDPDMNSWIPKVSTEWSGSIPATVIYKNDQRKFYEQSFTYEELETELKQFLN